MRSFALRTLALVPLVVAASAACGGGAGDRPPATSAGGPVSNGARAEKVASHTASADLPVPAGVEVSAIDTSVSPCDDFYQYACGNWIKKTEIPADEASWYRSFSVIRERNEEILRALLEGYAEGDGAGEPYSKPLGDFYASCTDEAGIEKLGTKPLEPWLKKIDEAKDAASLARVLGKFQADGMGIVFGLSAAQDFEDASKVLGMIWQGGLGMPEREYYLETTPKMTELRATYESHVAAMMQLAGEPEAKAKEAAKTVLTVETMLAQAWMTKEDRREPKKVAHRASRADLAKLVPGFPWDAWLDGAGAKGVTVYNVGQPEFMQAVGQMLGGKVSMADWKTYLRWHLYHEAAPELPKRFVDENFRWKQALAGVKSLPPRWKRCVRAIDGSMGEALAQGFVKKTLGAEGKANVVAMVQAIEKAMHGNLEALAWMDDPTRKAAFAKLGKIANKIAYPDKWRSYDGLAIDRGGYLGNVVHAAAFEYRRQLGKMGKPVDRGEWQMSPPAVNAYYDAQLNEMVFPAGILQPPFYANAAPMPINFGGIGMVMGHELTHGFDDEGRQFDADGNLKDWWSKASFGEFDQRAECVKKQFDDYTVLGDLHVNGKLTLGENIADLGGIKLALRAMHAQLESKAQKPDAAADRAFFIGFAQGWCGKMRDEALRLQVQTNPHAPAHLRVNGPVANSPEFAQAFSCKPDAKMVRKDRCDVW